MRSKDPFIATPDDVTGLLQVQQCQPQSIEASPWRVAYPVIDDEPAFRRFNGLGRQANLVGVPPCPRRASRTTQWSPQCLRSGEYDNQMFAFVPAKPGTGRCRRAQRPLIRRGRSAASLSSGGIMAPLRSNVRKSWSGERDQRPTGRIGRVCDGVSCQFLYPGDTRIFNTPDFFWIVLRIGGGTWAAHQSASW